MDRILRGVRVMEWGSLIAGPMAAAMLGDLGADVIKVEHPVHGDGSRGLAEPLPGSPPGTSVTFETMNRNKRSVGLDVSTPAGVELFREMVGACDVLITTVGRQAAQRFGLDYDDLRRRFPRLVLVYGGSGWGPRGPKSERRAMDVVIQAGSGIMAANSDPDEGMPELVSSAPVDNATGVMLAYAALAALIARDRFGVGQEVSASLLSTAFQLQANVANRALWCDEPPRARMRRGAHGPLIAWYRCADDRWLFVCERNFDRFWVEFATAIGVAPELSESLDSATLLQRCDDAFAQHPRSEWLDRFRELDCQFAYSPVETLDEALRGPEARENDYVISIDHPELGSTQALGFPVSFTATPCSYDLPAPKLGAHTDEVLQELCGLGWDDLIELKAKGVIY